jgi:hypothetical protein
MAGPATWSGADPLGALVWIAWTLALAAAGWLLVSVGLCTVAGATRNRSLARLAERIAIPAVRRLSERAVAMSFVVSTIVSPATLSPATAIAQPSDPPPIPVIAAVEPGEQAIPETPPRGVENADGPSATTTAPDVSLPVEIPAIGAQAPPARAPTAGALQTPATHVVAPGENLWTISCATLAGRLGRRPTEAETATYWAQVIDGNRGSLRSGNPDLIHPGETIVLPGNG